MTQEEWKTVPLEEIAKVEWGNTGITKKSYVDAGFTAFSATGPDGALDHFEWVGPAVVLSAIGARCGKCFFADGKWTAIKNTIVIQGDPMVINHKLLWYYLNDATRWYISGSGQPFITLKTARTTQVHLPPLEQQHQIVAEIEKQFSRLDEAVANLKRVKANLKRYKAAVLKAAVEGKLTEEWRKAHPDVEPASKLLDRILAERRAKWEEAELAKMEAKGKTLKNDKWKAKYKEPVAPDTEDLPELPEGWVWATVEQLACLVEYGSSAKTYEDPTGVPVLRMGNIVEGELRFDVLKYLPADHDEFPKLLLKPGDLLFNRTNSPELVGKTAVYADSPKECSFASYLIRVRLVGGASPKLLATYINSSHGRNWIKSVVTQQVGQANVNGTKLQALSAPLPPEREQDRIVAELDLRLSLLRETEAQVDANLRRAERLRQSTLSRVFSGQHLGVEYGVESADTKLVSIRT